MTVEELARDAARGDEEAFARLVALHEKRVYALTLRITGNQEDAADAAQEAFLSAWRGLPNFRGDAGFSTWLYRLASNAAIDHLRKNRRLRGEASLDDETLGVDAVDAAPSLQERAESAELREAVRRSMGELSWEHREALDLREYQELSYEEISERLGVDLGTVKSRISRARSALRKILLKSGNLSGYLPSNSLEGEKRGGRK
ncbi:MAG: sigma-70 family RNA polymerase sigma factor [Oscillibacter sp.]|nr:sigma-70 family RNA polymerase sigma factor [Oscillibacter sp.]